jgi:TolB-like protein/Tfp pilus assembly protein PilF
MFTDIVGYTALMDEDEQKAFELLKKNRQIQRPIIEKYHGRWLKEMGDGVLASFPTVTDAVYCAAAIQKTCEDEPELTLRIGIHQGEVVFDGEDVFGSGVNIASRLEPLAPAGGILVSESVHRNLGNKTNIVSSFIGEEQLRNVREPIRIYSVQVEGVEAMTTAEPISNRQQASPTTRSPKKIAFISLAVVIALALAYFFSQDGDTKSELAQPEQPEVIDKSIAVLPFKNDSPDADNQYFADGMMDEILNHLQKIAELGVKSRTAVEPYRNSTQSFETIAQELKVAFVLEGAVRKYGNRFRITTQLIEVESGNHLWSETYDGVFSDTIFVVQANIAKKIAASLNAMITPEEEASIEKVPTTNVAAYDLYIRADHERYSYTLNRNEERAKAAHDLYNQALKLDPNYMLAITGKADLFNVERAFAPEKNYSDSGLIYAEKAIALDPNFNRGYASKGYYYMINGQFELAEEYLLKAVSLPPYDDFSLSFHSGLGRMYSNRQRNGIIKALPHLRKALEMEGRQYITEVYISLGDAYKTIGEYEIAGNFYRSALESEVSCRAIYRNSGLSTVQGKFRESAEFLDSVCQPGRCDNSCLTGLFQTSWLMGEYEQAEEYYLQWVERAQATIFYNSINYEIGLVYFQLGRKNEAKEIFTREAQRLESELNENSHNTLLHLARISAFQGDHLKSIKYLTDYANKGFINGGHDFILIDPFFESLRDDPEFKAIVKNAQEEKAALREQVRQMEERGELTL